MRSRRASASFLAGFLAGLLALAVFIAAAGAQQERPNGAGMVVRHGDGTLIYAYVEFDSETITGEELLARAGLSFTVAPFGGFGAGICAIDDEGCPADDCWCASYSSPAYYWHYYAWNGSAWSALPHGASSRELRDGDIDGWSWTAGDHGLPPVSIDELARLNGFDRSPPATATPTPAPPSETPTAPALPPTVRPQPTATATSQATEPVPPAETPPETAGTATSTPPATATSAPKPSPKSTATESGAGRTAISTPAPAASPTPTESDGSAGAVIVRPSATPEPLEPSRDGDTSGFGSDLVIFSGFAAAILGAGLFLGLRRLRGGP
jgi:hypothetical protein